MAGHLHIKQRHRQSDDTIQQMLQALPIPSQVISTRITMVADNPRNGMPQAIAQMLGEQSGSIHWAMDQLKIKHLTVLGANIDNTSSWRYGHTDTGCRRLGYSVLAVSQAARQMCWRHQDRWRQRYGKNSTDSETLLFNVITELMANEVRRAERIQQRLDRQARDRVERLTERAQQRAQQRVRQQQAARLAALERFKAQVPSTDAVLSVIADPVYRFTAGIANSQIAGENTGTDK